MKLRTHKWEKVSSLLREYQASNKGHKEIAADIAKLAVTMQREGLRAVTNLGETVSVTAQSC